MRPLSARTRALEASRLWRGVRIMVARQDLGFFVGVGCVIADGGGRRVRLGGRRCPAVTRRHADLEEVAVPSEACFERE